MVPRSNIHPNPVFPVSDGESSLPPPPPESEQEGEEDPGFVCCDFASPGSLNPHQTFQRDY